MERMDWILHFFRESVTDGTLPKYHQRQCFAAKGVTVNRGIDSDSLQLQNLMVEAIGVHGIEDGVENFGSVAGHIVDAGDAALLQRIAGIEGLTDGFRVAADNLAAS